MDAFNINPNPDAKIIICNRKYVDLSKIFYEHIFYSKKYKYYYK